MPNLSLNSKLYNKDVKIKAEARHPWSMPVIPATQEAEIRKSMVPSQPKQILHKTLSWKTHHKTGLVEWCKVQALSSDPNTE
jgi:hypothetical protein